MHHKTTPARSAITVNCGRIGPALLAIGVAFAPGIAVAVPSEAHMQLLLNYSYIESYNSTNHASGGQNDTRESMVFFGTFRRPYKASIDNHVVTDIRELSPDEIKDATMPQPSQGGALFYSGHNVTKTRDGDPMTADKRYFGNFGPDDAAMNLFLGEGGFTIRLELRPKTLAGTCKYEAPHPSALCRATPIAGMAPSIDANDNNVGSMRWSNDLLPDTAPAPAINIEARDAYGAYIQSVPGRLLHVNGNADYGYSFSYTKTWTFQRKDPSGNSQAASKTLVVGGTLMPRDVKCLLTESVMSASFRAIFPKYPIQNFRSKVIKDGLLADFDIDVLPGAGVPGSTIEGDIVMQDNTYVVRARLYHPASRDPVDSDTAEGVGCQPGGNYAPGLDAAFMQTVARLILDELNRQYK